MKRTIAIAIAVGIALGMALMNIWQRPVYAQGVAYQISAAAGAAFIVSTNGTITECQQSGCTVVGHATP